MKVKLIVAQGVHEGREIPIAGTEFVIGRDPQCQLRPSSPAISKRHCALTIKGTKVYLRDFGSTNGTFLDEKPVQGEVEVTHLAHLKAGPLEFRVSIELPVPAAVVEKPKPKSKTEESDDDFAALLLDGDAEPGPGVPADGIPDGSTVMEMGAMGTTEAKPAAKPDDKKKNPEGDTRSAAADILRLYQRRPRS